VSRKIGSQRDNRTDVVRAPRGVRREGAAARDDRRNAPSVSIGLDLIEIDRVRAALVRYPGFRERCFTEKERAYCDSRADPAQHYAARFAGKEAVGKALASGVRFTWREIELAGRPKPGVRLSGKTLAWADRVGAGAIEVSMTHSRGIAAAVAVVHVGV
jgi:holo-[acyl-carrier protein] synthase